VLLAATLIDCPTSGTDAMVNMPGSTAAEGTPGGMYPGVLASMLSSVAVSVPALLLLLLPLLLTVVVLADA
jgi:hypothetical protein